MSNDFVLLGLAAPPFPGKMFGLLRLLGRLGLRLGTEPNPSENSRDGTEQWFVFRPHDVVAPEQFTGMRNQRGLKMLLQSGVLRDLCSSIRRDDARRVSVDELQRLGKLVIPSDRVRELRSGDWIERLSTRQLR